MTKRFIFLNKLYIVITYLVFDLTFHCVKSVGMGSYSGPYFPAYALYSDQMRENTDQNNSKYGRFSRSV